MECGIRRWRLEDALALSQALNNRNVQKNLRDGIPYPYTQRDAEDYIRSVLEADQEQLFAFAVVAGGTAIGSVGVIRKENIHVRTAELGYYIAEPFWGKGIGAQAVREACQWIFTHTDILRIFAEPFARNTASCRLLEKCGFEYEGTMRSNAVKDGVVLDMKLYALLRP